MKNLLKYTFQIWSKYVLTIISVLSFVTWFIPNIPDEFQFVKFIIGGTLIFVLILYFNIKHLINIFIIFEASFGLRSN